MIERLTLAHAMYNLNLYKARSRQACGEHDAAAVYFARAQTALNVIQGK